MITCFIRYTVNPEQLGNFELYAQVWMRLIEKYGGTHHGYFVPGDGPPSAEFSFPGLGQDGPDDVGIALFSFPTVEAYESYRREVANDPECLAITKIRDDSQCFTKYERTFLRSIPRQSATLKVNNIAIATAPIRASEWIDGFADFNAYFFTAGYGQPRFGSLQVKRGCGKSVCRVNKEAATCAITVEIASSTRSLTGCKFVSVRFC